MVTLRKYLPFIGLTVALLVVGAVLRFSFLNALPIFADESIYIRWSQVMKAEASLRFLPLSDGKQPFFMWVTIPFFKLIADPLLAGRVVSGLCGLGTALGTMFASWLLFKNRRIALISAALWLVLPYAVFFERLALADAMLAFFLIWAFNFMALALRHTRLDLGMVAGFCLGFAWLTKSPAMVAFVLLPFLLLLKDQKTISKLVILKSAGILMVAYAIAFGMYNILRLGPEFHMIALRNKDYIFPLSEIITHPFDPLKTNLKAAFEFYWYLATPIGVLLAISGLLDWRRTHKIPRLLLAAFLLVPILVQATIARTFTARYLLYTVPFAVILISHAIEHLGQHTRKHFLLAAGLIAVVVPSLWFDIQLLRSPETLPLPRIERSGYLEEWTAGFGLKTISSQLVEAANTQPVLVGTEGFFGTPFSAVQAYTNGHANIRVIGVGVYIDSVSDNLRNALKDNAVYLIVNSTRFHIDDPEKVGLKLIASYPKAVRPDGTREFTLFFQLIK